MTEPLRFGKLDHRGEFDELWVRNAYVHVERMDKTAFWIGIDIEDDRDHRLMVNTGVDRGVWYFNVEEEGGVGHSFTVRRPRSSTRQLPHEVLREVLGALRETLDVIGDADFAGRQRVEEILARASKNAGRRQ